MLIIGAQQLRENKGNLARFVGSCCKASKSNHDCIVYILFFFDHALERRTCTKMQKKLITRYATLAK
jgi:hypothetical protein